MLRWRDGNEGSREKWSGRKGENRIMEEDLQGEAKGAALFFFSPLTSTSERENANLSLRKVPAAACGAKTPANQLSLC